jgi:hypothetical protein
VVVLLLAGCDDPASKQAPAPAATTATTAPAPPPPPSVAPPGRARPDDDPRVAEFAGFTAPKPPTWLWQPPQGRMRAANYVVPGRSGANQAHLIVFQGIGGGAEANIARWTNQFRGPDEGPVDPELTTRQAGDLAVTLVELHGDRMKMGAGWYTDDQTLLAAIVDTPDGAMHITLAGDRGTVEDNRAAFLAMIDGLRRVDG